MGLISSTQIYKLEARDLEECPVGEGVERRWDPDRKKMFRVQISCNPNS